MENNTKFTQQEKICAHCGQALTRIVLEMNDKTYCGLSCGSGNLHSNPVKKIQEKIVESFMDEPIIPLTNTKLHIEYTDLIKSIRRKNTIEHKIKSCKRILQIGDILLKNKGSYLLEMCSLKPEQADFIKEHLISHLEDNLKTINEFLKTNIGCESNQ